MSQSSGFRNHRVAIFNRSVEDNDFGHNRQYVYTCAVWASVRFSKGVKSLREGALDAYDTLLFGMLYNPRITRESMLVYDGRTFQIQSFNRDYGSNEIQITATETPGKDLSTMIPYNVKNLLSSQDHVLVSDNEHVLAVKDKKNY